MGVLMVFEFYNPKKKHGTRPIYWVVRIIKYELMKNKFFSSKNRGKLISDYRIRKSYRHFHKIKIGQGEDHTMKKVIV